MFISKMRKCDCIKYLKLVDPAAGSGSLLLQAKKPFDAIASNPPYSINWIGSDDPTLINDERFAPAGVLAPKSKADFAFILHSLNYLSSRGAGGNCMLSGHILSWRSRTKDQKVSGR